MPFVGYDGDARQRTAGFAPPLLKSGTLTPPGAGLAVPSRSQLDAKRVMRLPKPRHSWQGGAAQTTPPCLGHGYIDGHVYGFLADHKLSGVSTNSSIPGAGISLSTRLLACINKFASAFKAFLATLALQVSTRRTDPCSGL